MMAQQRCAALALLALLAGSIPAATQANASNICGVESSLDITTSQSFEQVAQRALSSPDCPSEIKTAIKELQTVAYNEDVCSQDKADLISEFHTSYLLEKRVKLPKPLKNFFVAFALKVSKSCRDLPFTRLLQASEKLTTAYDWSLIDKYIDEGGLLTLVINGAEGHFNDLVPPRNLVRMLNGKNQKVQMDKVFLQVWFVAELRRLQAQCERRFAPLYEPEVLPLVTLASLGYKYRDSNEAGRNPEQVEAILKWYRAIFLCESLRNVVLIRTAGADDHASSDSRQQVNVLSRGEAEELRKTRPELFEHENEHNIRRLEHRPAAASLDEPILDTANKQFVKAVRDFKARPGFVSRTFDRMRNYLADKVSRGLVKYSFSRDGIKLGSLRIRNTDELLAALDTYRDKYYDREYPRQLSQREFNSRANFAFWSTVCTLFVGVLVASFVIPATAG